MKTTTIPSAPNKHRDGRIPGTGRRGRPPLDPEVRRKRIMDVASALFIRNGYSDTTLDAVGKAAGVTKRTIYELVGDKEALFRAISNDIHLRIWELPDPPKSGENPRDTLLSLATALVDEALSDEVVSFERTLIIEQMRFPDLIKEVIGNTRRNLNRKIAVFFDSLVAQGVVDLADTFKTTEIFFDIVVGNAGFRRALGLEEQPPTADDIAERVDIFMEGHLGRHGLKSGMIDPAA